MRDRNGVPCLHLCARLRGVSPSVWRRLLVPANSTIAELHAVIQMAMGWEDQHLHAFEIRGERFGVCYAGGVHFRTSADKVRLGDFAFRERERFAYVYDFYSEWLTWHKEQAVEVWPLTGQFSLPRRSSDLEWSVVAWSNRIARRSRRPFKRRLRVLCASGERESADKARRR